ncbi:hypothetical protein DFJ74DRAFT_705876 [Hyaloraphidium curvatum]|nr:hypothetical protein DFJ74DRAFT_705876 [Hyaloraphidium curvatum]
MSLKLAAFAEDSLKTDKFRHSYMDYWDEASEGDEYDEDDDDWGPSDTLLKLRARKIAAARTDRDQKVELSDHESDAESYKGTYVPRERQFGIWNWKEGEPFVNESYPQAKLPQNVTRLTLERTIGRLNAKVDRVTIDADYHDVFLARGLRPRSLEISNGEVWEQELGNYLEEPPETDELERVVINLANLPAGLKELDIVPSDGDLDDPRQILNVPTERLGDLKRSIREAQLERLFVSGLDQYEYSGGEERECWKEIIAEHGKRFREADD